MLRQRALKRKGRQTQTIVFLFPFLMHVAFEPTRDVYVPISSGAISMKKKSPGKCPESHLGNTYPKALIVRTKLRITNELCPTPAKGCGYLPSAVDSVHLSHFPTPPV